MCGRRPVGKDCFDADARLVGAAMCSTYVGGAYDRWPSCLPQTGPDQNHAFQDALAQVGCPASRFDRLLHDRPLALSNLVTASAEPAAFAQASIPIRQGGSKAKNGSTCPRLIWRWMTMVPA